MKNKEVVESFLQEKVGNSLNLTSTGYKLFSYNTCIAEWYKDSLIINTTKYSRTTSNHQHYLRDYKGGNIIYVAGVPINTTALHNYLTDKF